MKLKTLREEDLADTALDTALHNAASALVRIAVKEEGSDGDVPANFEDNVKNIANVIRDKAKPMLADAVKKASK